MTSEDMEDINEKYIVTGETNTDYDETKGQGYSENAYCNKAIVVPESTCISGDSGTSAIVKSRRQRLLLSTLTVLLLGAVIASGVFYAMGSTRGSLAGKVLAKGKPALAQSQTPESARPASLLISGLNPNTIADIVDKVGAAVVTVETATSVPVRSGNSSFDDQFFRQFFGVIPPSRPNARKTQGLGSGFLISSDGYILTNEHVVSGADQVQITIAGHKDPLPAQVIGSDTNLDLAILKIKAGHDLPYLTLGDSQSLRVGEWVIAIGNPYGLDHTVTVGVISAKGRPITLDDHQYQNLLQTDASINPGNSGGPLLNLQGEVIGINAAINAQAQGIGFAIPTQTVQDVLNELMTKGKVTRPWIGIGMQPVTEEFRNHLGLTKAEGAIILQVVAGSPADEAGLQRGDVILELNGKAIKTPDDLTEIVKGQKVGDKVIILLWRNQESLYMTVTLGESN